MIGPVNTQEPTKLRAGTEPPKPGAAGRRWHPSGDEKAKSKAKEDEKAKAKAAAAKPSMLVPNVPKS